MVSINSTCQYLSHHKTVINVVTSCWLLFRIWATRGAITRGRWSELITIEFTYFYYFVAVNGNIELCGQVQLNCVEAMHIHVALYTSLVTVLWETFLVPLELSLINWYISVLLIWESKKTIKSTRRLHRKLILKFIRFKSDSNTKN